MCLFAVHNTKRAGTTAPRCRRSPLMFKGQTASRMPLDAPRRVDARDEIAPGIWPARLHDAHGVRWAMPWAPSAHQPCVWPLPEWCTHFPSTVRCGKRSSTSLQHVVRRERTLKMEDVTLFPSHQGTPARLSRGRRGMSLISQRDGSSKTP